MMMDIICMSKWVYRGALMFFCFQLCSLRSSKIPIAERPHQHTINRHLHEGIQLLEVSHYNQQSESTYASRLTHHTPSHLMENVCLDEFRIFRATKYRRDMCMNRWAWETDSSHGYSHKAMVQILNLQVKVYTIETCFNAHLPVWMLLLGFQL